MIELKKFAEVSREQVMEAWNVSFADYVVEMMLTEEAFLQEWMSFY
ncbi:hypothetical protein [Listeria aquatica]